MRKILLLVFYPILFFECSTSQEYKILKMRNLKTTMLEIGNKNKEFNINQSKILYKKLIFKYYSNKNYIIVSNTDTIKLYKTIKSVKIVDNDILKKYPTDNINLCVEKKGSDCEISQTLQKMLNEENISFSLGKSSIEQKDYLFFYLKNNKYALLNNNEFLILFFR